MTFAFSIKKRKLKLKLEDLNEGEILSWLQYGWKPEFLRLLYSVLNHNQDTTVHEDDKVAIPSKLLIPVNETGYHWILLVVDLSSGGTSKSGNVALDSLISIVDSNSHQLCKGWTPGAFSITPIDLFSKLFGVMSHILTSSQQYIEHGVYIGSDDFPY